MELAEIVALVQILSGLGAAAVDVTKVVEAIKARGDTHATLAEEQHIRVLSLPLHEAVSSDPVGFLKAMATGGAG